MEPCGRSVCLVIAQAAVGATQASVGPGDVLYLPPMYFHHVTSLGTSLSVNVWTACADERVVEQITAATRTYLSSSAWREGLMHQLPSAARIDAPRLAPLSALAAFVPLVVAAGLRARSFVDDLYAERYAELVATSEIPKPSLHGAHSLCMDTTAAGSAASGGSQRLVQCRRSLDEELQRSLLSLAQLSTAVLHDRTHAHYMQQVEPLIHELSQETRQTWLFNLFEYWVANTVGLAQVGTVLADLACCGRLVDLSPKPNRPDH